MKPSVLLLGAGRGLGRALLRFFLKREFPVFCVTRTRSSLTSISDEFSEDHRLLSVEAFDLSDRQCAISLVGRLASQANSFGFPILAIYPVGFLSGRLSLLEETIADIDQEVETNFRVPLFWSRLLSRHFLDRGEGGHLFISSGVATIPRPGWGAYGISKGGLEALSAQLALDLPPPFFSLTLNPGGMATDMRRLAYPEEDQLTLPSPDKTATKIGNFCLSLMEGQGRKFNGHRLQMGDLP